MAFQFPKQFRLKNKTEITRLFNEGKEIKVFPIKLLYLETSSCTKAVFSVPKRNFKHAVVRNRIKRQMREAFRLMQPLPINKPYLLFILYIGSKKPLFVNVAEALEKALNKVEKN